LDNGKLTDLLRDTANRQFWIKPWGSRDFPDQPDAKPGTQFFAASQLEITFSKSKNPPDINEGDIFLVYHVRMSHMDAPKLVCVTEACSSPSYATTEQLEKETWRPKWPWSIQARNLTPAYGSKWSRYSLNPFRMTKEFNAKNPSAKVTLGAINFGATKLRIREDFARFLLKEIIRLS
jgi:hypothetical protein